MKTITKIILSAAAVLVLPVLSLAQGRSIYGADNRLVFYEASADMKVLSLSVVSFWKSAKVVEYDGGYSLTTKPFGDALGLCPGEKFRDQFVGAFCSGSLVGEDLVITAGHCVKDETGCADTRLVFGFLVNSAGGTGPSTVAKSEVYKCAKIVKRFLGGEPGSANPAGQALGPDYALIQLDRKVKGHKPLPINRGALAKGAKVFVIGHPVGLPLKVAGDASVRDASKKGYFVADLDTFGGNSGSPVFNASTKKIEGILVRGDTDFVKSPAGCTTMATYEQTGGRGEDVTKISELAAFIPKVAGEKSTTEYQNVNTKNLAPAATPPAANVRFQ